MKIEVSSKDVDKCETDVVVLLFFSDEKPLKGASGLVDWRMNGSLSELVKSEHLLGEKGESTLIAPQGRIKGKMIIMVGLGKSSHRKKKEIENAAASFMVNLLSLNAKTVAIAIPPERFTYLKADQVATTLITGMNSSGKKSDHLTVTLLTEQEDLEAVNQILEKAA